MSVSLSSRTSDGNNSNSELFMMFSSASTDLTRFKLEQTTKTTPSSTPSKELHGARGVNISRGECDQRVLIKTRGARVSLASLVSVYSTN